MESAAGCRGGGVDAQYKVSRDQHVWEFSAEMEPVLTVDPGAVIELETWDCFTGQVTSADDMLDSLDFNRLNSATGPIYVRGAEPGDSLSVTLLDVVPAETGSAMIIPGTGQLVEYCQAPQTRILKIADGTVWLNDHVSFPAKPMVGVIGVAPAEGAVGTALAGRHGGNLDDTRNTIGATIHFPVAQPGALLALGDMHASMGDGEISFTGVECNGSVLIKVDLVKGKSARWPITEAEDCWYTHGTSDESLTDAIKFACEDAANLLVDEWGFSMEDAFIFLSCAGDVGIAQACSPADGSIIANMRVPKISACPAPFKRQD
jgi:amidase